MKEKKVKNARWTETLELALLSGNGCRCGFLGVAVRRSSAMRNRRDH